MNSVNLKCNTKNLLKGQIILGISSRANVELK